MEAPHRDVILHMLIVKKKQLPQMCRAFEKKGGTHGQDWWLPQRHHLTMGR
jgi:hypothetical protein